MSTWWVWLVVLRMGCTDMSSLCISVNCLAYCCVGAMSTCSYSSLCSAEMLFDVSYGYVSVVRSGIIGWYPVSYVVDVAHKPSSCCSSLLYMQWLYSLCCRLRSALSRRDHSFSVALQFYFTTGVQTTLSTSLLSAFIVHRTFCS